jgi:predicted phosphoribosyltransferase
MFENRIEAGGLLAKRLEHLQNQPVVVVAIPRGGLPIGAVLAEALHAPLDIALIKKIGHPLNREYAMGALTLHHCVLDLPQEISQDYLDQESARLRSELREREALFYRIKTHAQWKNKIIVLTDDGIATGNTLRAAVALVHTESPKGIVIAIPVAPADTIPLLKKLPGVQEVVCLETPEYFEAVGAFYKDFSQVSDSEAVAIFERGL